MINTTFYAECNTYICTFILKFLDPTIEILGSKFIRSRKKNFKMFRMLSQIIFLFVWILFFKFSLKYKHIDATIFSDFGNRSSLYSGFFLKSQLSSFHSVSPFVSRIKKLCLSLIWRKHQKSQTAWVRDANPGVGPGAPSSPGDPTPWRGMRAGNIKTFKTPVYRGFFWKSPGVFREFFTGMMCVSK